MTAFHALRVANFKAFGRSQRVPLRPLTLLFGANSAGKSSVLHALALAHHAAETGHLDVQRTRLGGDSIDLGGFGQYVHRRVRNQEVTLTFELDPISFAGRLGEVLGAAQGVEVEVGIGMAGGDSDNRAGVQRFAIGVDGQELLAMSGRRGQGLRLDRANHAHPIFRETLRGILVLSTTAQGLREDELGALARVVDELVPQIATWQRSGLFVGALADRERAEGQSRIQPISRSHRHDNLAQAARHLLPDLLSELVGGISGVLEEEIRKLQYLGPLRSYPPRHLAFAQHHDANRLAGGGYAWDEVRGNDEVRKRVNDWLGDASRLKTPYELQVRELLPTGRLSAGLESRLRLALHNFAAGLLGVVHPDAPALGAEHSQMIAAAMEAVHGGLPEAPIVAGKLADSINFSEEVADVVEYFSDSETEVEHWTKELVAEQGEELRDLVLIDKRFGTPMSHRDVGIGVSQLLPVLVSAYASSNKLIAIEQPEIHLHPALQAEVGDVFLESALGESGNRFLIETHSEHLILRLLRRIRETSEGDLRQDATPVRPEDVAVLYVQPGPEGAEIIELPITPDGEFERRWPDGFFAERAKELF